MSTTEIFDKEGNLIRRRVVIDCQKAIDEGEKILVEQHHQKEVDINNIIKKHGAEYIKKVNALRSGEFHFDDVTGNDFQEAMIKVRRAQEIFESMPSKIRAEFENNPAKYLDYVQNPDNRDELIQRGWIEPEAPVMPVRVIIDEQASVAENAETP